jgi:carbonic anhydrase
MRRHKEYTMPLRHLLQNNKEWAAQTEAERPGFFTKLSQQQNPKYMWIGCSDSRVPANQIVKLDPGEVFVHRNVANVLVHTDLNALSAVQYAVDMLKVQHIVVCGHYGCGGVQAALTNTRVGLADNWIRHIQDVRDKHQTALDAMPESARLGALCELNVIEQVENLANSTVMQDAWSRGQNVQLHGWIYGVENGVIQDLHISPQHAAEVRASYRQSIDQALVQKR